VISQRHPNIHILDMRKIYLYMLCSVFIHPNNIIRVTTTAIRVLTGLLIRTQASTTKWLSKVLGAHHPTAATMVVTSKTKAFRLAQRQNTNAMRLPATRWRCQMEQTEHTLPFHEFCAGCKTRGWLRYGFTCIIICIKRRQLAV